MACSAAQAQLVQRFNHTLTLLPSGNFLVIGGNTNTDDSPSYTGTIQEYSVKDYAYHNYTPLWGGVATLARSSHTATLLPSGDVLVAGGTDDSGVVTTNSVCTYNPTTHLLRWCGSLGAPRTAHTATLLKDGTVLIAGGRDASGNALNSLELVNPLPAVLPTVTPLSATLATARWGHTATLLPSGTVFLAGGYNPALGASTTSYYISTTELYLPDKQSVAGGPALGRARAFHTATAMNNGRVLVAGGYNAGNQYIFGNCMGYIDSTEFYDPYTSAVIPGENMPVRLASHSAALDTQGKVVLYGGLGNVTTQYFSGPLKIQGDVTKIYLTPISTYPYSNGTINSNSVIALRGTHSWTMSATGIIANGQAYFSRPSDITQHYIENSDLNLDFTSPMSQLVNHQVLKGTFMAPITPDDSFSYPLYLQSPSGTASFKPGDFSGTTTNPEACQLAFNAPLAEGQTVNLDPNNSYCTLMFTIPLKETDYVADGTSQLKQAYAILQSGTLTGAYDVGTLTVAITSGTALSVGLSTPVVINALTGMPEVQVTMQFVGIEGTITTSSGIINSSPITIAPNIFANSDIGGAALYFISPVTASDSFNTQTATVVIAGMISSDFVSYRVNPGGDSLATNTGAHHWVIGGSPNASIPADPASSMFANVYGTLANSSLYTPGSIMLAAGGKKCIPTGAYPYNDCSGTESTNVSGALSYWPPVWNSGAIMNYARGGHTATLLPDNRLLVIGGSDGFATHNTGEYYAQGTNVWTLANGRLSLPRTGHAATLMSDGNVLVTGGYTQGVSTGIAANTDIYYTGANAFVQTSSMNTARQGHTTVLLPSGPYAGRVMVMGGRANSGSYTSSCEVYFSTVNPATQVSTAAWVTLASMNAARTYHTATILHDGRILVAGGYNGGQALSSAEIYNPAANTWTAVHAMNTARYYHTATLTRFGNVLVAGGSNNLGEIFSEEIYDPDTDTWTQMNFPVKYDLETPSVQDRVDVPRYRHTATLLPNGNIMFIGGARASAAGADSSLVQAQGIVSLQYTELPNTMIGRILNQPGSSYELGVSRVDHTTTIMPDGNMIIAGGYDGNHHYLPSTETSYFMEPRDATDPPLMRSPTELSADTTVYSNTGAPITLRSATTTFFGITEASGGGTSNTSHNHPRVCIYMTDTPSGYMLDLSTYVYATALLSTDTYHPADSLANWSLLPSSITIDIPNLPNGWYQFRVGENAQYSNAWPLYVGTPLPALAISAPETINGVAFSSTVVHWNWNAAVPAASTTTPYAYRIFTSTSSSIAIIPADYTPFYNEGGLLPNTAYSIMVQTCNNLNCDMQTALVSSPTTYTMAEPATPHPTQAVTVSESSMTGTWYAIHNPPGTTYILEISTDAAFSSTSEIFTETIAQTAPSTAPITGAATTLIPNTSYAMRVTAVNTQEVQTTPPVYLTTSTYTRAQAPGNTGFVAAEVTASTAKLVWDPQKNPDYTQYIIYMSTDPSGTSGTFQLLVDTSTNLTLSTYVVTGLRSQSTYYFSVMTQNKAGVNTLVTPLFPNGYIVTGAGPCKGSGQCAPAGSLVLAAGDGQLSGAFTDGRTLQLTVPAGAFLSTATLVAVSEDAFGTDTCVGTGASHVCNHGVTASTTCPSFSIYTTDNIQPRTPLQITIGYSTNNTADEFAAITDKSLLALARLNDVNQCKPMQTTVNSSAKQFSVALDRVSRLQIIQPAPITNLDSAYVSPNPFYPNRGQGSVTFRNLPPNTSVRIYTLSGVKVWEGAGSTAISWPGKNSGGADVASGVYLAVLNGAGGSKILKLAVER